METVRRTWINEARQKAENSKNTESPVTVYNLFMEEMDRLLEDLTHNEAEFYLRETLKRIGAKCSYRY